MKPILTLILMLLAFLSFCYAMTVWGDSLENRREVREMTHGRLVRLTQKGDSIEVWKDLETGRLCYVTSSYSNIWCEP